MKKLFVLIIAMCISFSFSANAQAYAKQKAKLEKKEFKARVKKYQKDGWELMGSSHTLEMAVVTHYEALAKEGVKEITGYATSSNKNIGKEKLMLSACATYAEMIGANVKGRVISDIGSVLSTEELSEFENFYAAFENQVKAEIRGEMRPSYTVYRAINVNGKPAYEFEELFIIDEAAASRARIRAFQNAAKESEIARKYAEQVSKFIEEATIEEE